MGYHQAMQKHIESQVRYWNERKHAIEKIEFAEHEDKKQNPFITLSREYGVGAFGIAEKIVSIINEKHISQQSWAAYDKSILDKITGDLGLSKSLAETLTDNARKKMTDLLQTSFSKFPPQVAVYRKLVEVIRTLAITGNVVVVGRAGNIITKDMVKGFHVRLVAPMQYRAESISRRMKVNHREAEELILARDSERDGFISEYVKFDNTDPKNYHLTVNLGFMSEDEAARLVIESMKACGYF